MSASSKLRSAGFTLLVCLAVGYAVTWDRTTASAVVCGVIAVGGLCMLPRCRLPGLALVAALLIPTTDLPVPLFVRGASLGALPLVVWLCRARGSAAGSLWTIRMLGLAFACWLIASEVFAPIRTKRGVEWLIMILATVVLVALAAGREIDAAKLRRSFLAVTSALGVLAVVETYLLGDNLIYGRLYSAAEPPLVQHWSHYRATTLMGHPLVNATIFACAVALAVNEVVTVRGNSRLPLLELLCVVGGLAATDSRGGALAAGVGVVFALIFANGHARSGSRRLIVLAVVVLAAAVVLVGLSARDETHEGQSSAQARLDVPQETSEAMAGTTLLGAGPGESQAYRVLRNLPSAKSPLENGYAQLVVSIGVVGTLLFILIIISVCIRGLRSRDRVAEACALIAMLVAVAGYNALENYPGLLVVFALLMMSIMGGGSRRIPGVAVPVDRERVIVAVS